MTWHLRDPRSHITGTEKLRKPAGQFGEPAIYFQNQARRVQAV